MELVALSLQGTLYDDTMQKTFLLILTDPGLQRSGTLLHWFGVVVLPILEAFFKSILKVILEFTPNTVNSHIV